MSEQWIRERAQSLKCQIQTNGLICKSSSVQFSHFVVPAGKIGLLTGSEEIAHKKNNIKAQKNNAQLPQKDIILHLKERKNTKIYFF